MYQNLVLVGSIRGGYAFPIANIAFGLRWGPRRYWMARHLASRMLLIISSTLDHPIPGFHGLFAAGEVLLGEEGLLIGCDLAEILGAVADSFRDCGEADASEEFTFGRNGAALHFLTEVQAVTVFRLGGCYAVSTKQHFGARVLTVLARFAECAGDMIDTGTPFYFCHLSSAFAEQTVLRTDRPFH